MPTKGGHLKKRLSSSTKVVHGLQKLTRIFITNNLDHMCLHLQSGAGVLHSVSFTFPHPGLGTRWRAPIPPVWLQFWISSQWETSGLQMLCIPKSFLPLCSQGMAMELSRSPCYRSTSRSQNRCCLHIPWSNAHVENTPKAEASVKMTLKANVNFQTKKRSGN